MDNWEKPSGRKTDPGLVAAARGDNGVRASSVETLEINKSQLVPDPNQPRRTFPQEVIDERQGQLEANGQESPITVLPGKEVDGVITYQIVDGECRWRASMQSEVIEFLRAEVFAGNDDEETILTSQLLHNDDGSEGITNFERAVSWLRLMTLREEAGSSAPLQDVADRLNKSKDEVSRVVSLASVSEEVKTFALEYGVDDPKVFGSIRQIEKHGAEGELQSALLSLGASFAGGENIRKASAALAADVKTRAASSKTKGKAKAKSSKKEAKPVRNLGATHVKLKLNDDGSGVLDVVTPREQFKFKLPSEVAALINVSEVDGA